MRNPWLYILFFTLAAILSGHVEVYAQLHLDTEQSISSLVNDLFLRKSVKAFNIKYKGTPQCKGYFRNYSRHLPVDSGLILATGPVTIAAGPNDRPNAGTDVNTRGDRDLDNISGWGKSLDAAVLEFDFIPSSDSISFNYIFGSEEYPEYVGSRFNDKFGFFLSGPGIKDKINLAMLPGDRGPVTINNINAKRNPQYYIDNSYYNDKYGRLKLLYKLRGYEKVRNSSLQYDGYTTLLTAKAKVIPYHIYHIKIAISDVEDHRYDSGVFLQAGSFRSYKSGGDKMEYVYQPLDTVRRGVQLPQVKVLDTKTSSYTLRINFDFDSDIIPDTSLWELNKVYDYARSLGIKQIEIVGHTDSMGSRPYNLVLSERRANSVKQYLTARGLEPRALSTKGAGFDIPVKSNSTPEGRAQNRRVEFIFRQE